MLFLLLTGFHGPGRAAGPNDLVMKVGVAADLRLRGNHGENVVLTQDDVLLAGDADVGARVLAHQDPVALLDVDRHALAVVRESTRSHRHDRALLGLLLGGSGDDDASALRLLLFRAPDQKPVCEGLHVHGTSLGMRARGHADSPAAPHHATPRFDALDAGFSVSSAGWAWICGRET